MRTSWIGIIAAGGAGGPVDLSHVANASGSGSSSNSATASGVNFGSQGGALIVALSWSCINQLRAVTAVNAGGKGLTRILRATSSSVLGSAELWGTEVNVSGSGNLTMSINSTANSVGFEASIFRAPRLRGITPYDTATRDDAVTIVGTDLTQVGFTNVLGNGAHQTRRFGGDFAATGTTANLNVDSNGSSAKRLVMASFR